MTSALIHQPSISEFWLLLLLRLGAANWVLEIKTSLFELSEVSLNLKRFVHKHYISKDHPIPESKTAQIKIIE